MRPHTQSVTISNVDIVGSGGCVAGLTGLSPPLQTPMPHVVHAGPLEGGLDHRLT